MAEYRIYKLHFTSPLHIGDARDGYDVSLKTIQSDAMYAAIISALAKIGQDIPKDGDMGFIISSLFPFYQASPEVAPVLFFPKPKQQRLPKLQNVADAKKVKKVKWLDQRYFEKTLQGRPIVETQDDVESVKGDFLTRESVPSEFAVSRVSQRVSIDRLGTRDANPFYMDRLYFEDYSGLYFLAQGNVNQIEMALNLLRTEGVGTSRSIGNGQFEWDSGIIDIQVPNDTNYAMAMSIYIPESQTQLQSMTNGDLIAYDLIRRGGWITTPPHTTIRKNTIYAFAAGSVFSKADSVSTGAIVDLAPRINIGHPIWRCGRSLFFPIKL